MRINSLWVQGRWLALIAALWFCQFAYSTILAIPAQTLYANTWFPRDATHWHNSTAAEAAIYYNLVDYRPGYVERSACHVIGAGYPLLYSATTAPFGLFYTYTGYTSQCTDMWGGPRYGTVIFVGPLLQCPSNSVLTDATCVCQPSYAEIEGACKATLGPVVPEPESGSPDQAGMCMGHPILPATGEKVLTQTDFAGSGPAALDFTRSYRSSRVVGAATGVDTSGLGQAWSHNHAVSSRQIGIAGSSDSTARVLFGDGTLRAFAWNPASSTWTASNGADTLTDNTTGLLYKRQHDDSAWQFDAAGKLLTMTQRNGWVTTYTYSTSSTPVNLAPAAGLLIGVTNPFGRTLGFTYNAAGQLISVATPDGQTHSYQYDGNPSTARLTSVTYPTGAGGTVSKTYIYENTTYPQLLTGIIDEAGKRLASYAYDSQGRGVSTEYAGGADRYSIVYGATPADPVQVTDPLGTQRSYSYGTALNKLAVTGATLASGSGGSDAASRVQNASGLVDSETDFLGVRTMYTWDINRRLPLATTRAANRPESQTTSTQWHPTFRLPMLVSEPGRSTAYTYDTTGNQLSEAITDTATSQTRTWAWTWNTQGLVATSIDARGMVSRYAYDASGNLTSVKNPLGQETRYAYDAAGRVTQETAPNGLVSAYSYDPRGRVLHITRGSEATTLGYTPSGQLSGLSLPSGYAMAYSFDAAQRLTGATDNRNNRIQYTLDAMGNRVREEVKDPSGTLAQVTTRSINHLNRVATISGEIGRAHV